MIRILKALVIAGAPDVHEIRDIVGLSISRVRELVKQAVTEGLIEGTPDADDIMVYGFTDKGLAALAEVEAGNQDDAEGLPAVLEEPAEEPEAPVKAKRVVLNPQPIIDKKTAVLAGAGFALTYASRVWTIRNETGSFFSFDSQTLASVKVAEIVEYANMCMPSEAPIVA